MAADKQFRRAAPEVVPVSSSMFVFKHNSTQLVFMSGHVLLFSACINITIHVVDFQLLAVDLSELSRPVIKRGFKVIYLHLYNFYF